MDGLSQQEIIDMYSSQVANMEGGRRRRGRPRKRRGAGLVGGVLDASQNVEGYVSGSGLVGGRRRVGRPRKSAARPKMTAKVMEFFASKKRKKRGRGLVGGKSNQDIYDELVDSGVEVTPDMVRLMQAGIQPETEKERLVRQIRNWEKKLNVGQSSAEKLHKYTAKALAQILEIYKTNSRILAYPPLSNRADIFEEDRFETPKYEFAARRPNAKVQEAALELEGLLR
jgi:hypothetical protein